MPNEANKSNLEKTREHEKKEWLKFHSDDKSKGLDFSSEHGKLKRCKKLHGESLFYAIMGLISFLALVVLWIALFYKVDIGIIALPATTASLYFFSYMYFKQSESFDKVCLFFVVCIAISVITSLISWFSSNTNISGTAIFNIILSAFLFWFMTKNQ